MTHSTEKEGDILQM